MTLILSPLHVVFWCLQALPLYKSSGMYMYARWVIIIMNLFRHVKEVPIFISVSQRKRKKYCDAFLWQKGPLPSDNESQSRIGGKLIIRASGTIVDPGMI